MKPAVLNLGHNQIAVLKKTDDNLLDLLTCFDYSIKWFDATDRAKRRDLYLLVQELSTYYTIRSFLNKRGAGVRGCFHRWKKFIAACQPQNGTASGFSLHPPLSFPESRGASRGSTSLWVLGIYTRVYPKGTYSLKEKGKTWMARDYIPLRNCSEIANVHARVYCTRWGSWWIRSTSTPVLSDCSRWMCPIKTNVAWLKIYIMLHLYGKEIKEYKDDNRHNFSYHI
jgi:hypothetical protein